jgi:hypothetical protein
MPLWGLAPPCLLPSLPPPRRALLGARPDPPLPHPRGPSGGVWPRRGRVRRAGTVPGAGNLRGRLCERLAGASGHSGYLPILEVSESCQSWGLPLLACALPLRPCCLLCIQCLITKMTHPRHAGALSPTDLPVLPRSSQLPAAGQGGAAAVSPAPEGEAPSPSPEASPSPSPSPEASPSPAPEASPSPAAAGASASAQASAQAVAQSLGSGDAQVRRGPWRSRPAGMTHGAARTVRVNHRTEAHGKSPVLGPRPMAAANRPQGRGAAGGAQAGYEIAGQDRTRAAVMGACRTSP